MCVLLHFSSKSDIQILGYFDGFLFILIFVIWSVVVFGFALGPGVCLLLEPSWDGRMPEEKEMYSTQTTGNGSNKWKEEWWAVVLNKIEESVVA